VHDLSYGINIRSLQMAATAQQFRGRYLPCCKFLRPREPLGSLCGGAEGILQGATGRRGERKNGTRKFAI